MKSGYGRMAMVLLSFVLAFGLCPALAFAQDVPDGGDSQEGAGDALAPVDLGTIEPEEPGGEDDPEYTGPVSDVYRFVDPYSCRHLYTPSSDEASDAERAGWTRQGVAWKAPETSDSPAYRVYNPYSGEHFYTADADERDTLVSVGWQDEGVGFYTLASSGVPIFRLYNLNPLDNSGDHVFTASEQERQDLIALGWEDEGVKFYGAEEGDSYDGTPDWAEVIVEDEATGVVARSMTFAQQALKGNTVRLVVANVAKEDPARYYDLRKQYFLTRTYAFAVYDVKLVLQRADGTTEDYKSGFSDVDLTFPLEERFNGKSARLVHLGTRSNGKEYVISRKTATVEDGAVSTTVTHFSEFIITVGDSDAVAEVPSAEEPDDSSEDPADDPSEDPADGSGEGESQAVQEMYRLYNPNSGEHFYTADADERDAVVKAGWVYEGVGWIAPVHSGTPVYRLYSGTDHHYTMSEEERDEVIAAGWKDEGIGWYSDDDEGVPLLRQYNPNVDPNASVNNAGAHNYTTSVEENDNLVQIGWIAEGIGWYGVLQEAAA